MLPSPDQIERLPIWAQKYIEDLERGKASAERRAERIEEERDTSGRLDPEKRICWEYLMEGEHPLPRFANIRVYTDRERHAYITCRWNESHKTLDINASETLVVYPYSSNAIEIKTQQR